MAAVTVRVPAKINVYLGVGPVNDEGYHDLATIFQAISVYDDVTVERSDTMSVTVRGPWADLVPADASNLAWHAAELVAEAAGWDARFDITIDKAIPVAGGLAGGSADAAATLLACNEVLGSALGWEQLEDLASRLGSDVPFLLHGGCALGTGRGIHLTPVMTRGVFHWVLATFSEGLSTAEVYRSIDAMRGPDFATFPEVPGEVLRGLAQGDAVQLATGMSNDLQAAAVALRPALQVVLDEGRLHGASGGIVSGSGPTCVFLVDSESLARDLATALRSSGLVDGVIAAHGPVHGARAVTG